MGISFSIILSTGVYAFGDSLILKLIITCIIVSSTYVIAGYRLRMCLDEAHTHIEATRVATVLALFSK